MTQFIDTLIIGGGQAGLSLSYYLTQQQRPHLILEQSDRLADAWRRRWDSFTLVTPNWQLHLPGFAYQGDQPDAFLTREEVVDYLENYAASFDPPVRFGVRAAAVDRADGGYKIDTSEGVYKAANVVIATGTFQQPKVPSFSGNLAPDAAQLHTSEYRSPGGLPPGAVLVVGSGQSGSQIAEELHLSGRKVYLSTCKAGRVPRRYRGQDCMRWLNRMGFYDRTVDRLPSPRARFAGNPHLTGKDGGHTINLHQFARDGVTLLGHLVGASGRKVFFAPDLHACLAAADKLEAEIVQGMDDYIAKNGLDAPPETLPRLQDGYDAEVITELDLRAAGITSVVWAIGYQFDFRWVNLPVLDEDGYPLQQRGVTDHPGLYFLGLHWLHSFKSALFWGVGEDAAHIANTIAM